MTSSRRRVSAQALLAAVLAFCAAWAAQAQTPPTAAPAQTPPAVRASQPPATPKEPRPARVRPAPPPRAEARPTWAELTPQQQQALAPLEGSWRSMGEGRKRKWLAVSRNYRTMTPAEQERMHGRMSEWAALSPQQRDAARLNYGEARKVSPSDKRAMWEAYQALSPEEKRQLAAGARAAKPPPPPTAVATRPVPPQQLAKIQKPSKADKPPRAAASAPRAAASAPRAAVPGAQAAASAARPDASAAQAISSSLAPPAPGAAQHP